eukprot:10474929-Alexandrium_andersonii.AAC.1
MFGGGSGGVAAPPERPRRKLQKAAENCGTQLSVNLSSCLRCCTNVVAPIIGAQVHRNDSFG